MIRVRNCDTPVNKAEIAELLGKAECARHGAMPQPPEAVAAMTNRAAHASSGPTPSCLTSAIAYLLAIPIVWLFREWLQQGLDAIRAELLAWVGLHSLPMLPKESSETARSNRVGENAFRAWSRLTAKPCDLGLDAR